jgi:hypothetical protein
VTRARLRADEALRRRYYDWWFRKRRDFLGALTNYLRQSVNPDAVVLFTSDSSEPGRPLNGPMTIVTDDPATWNAVPSRPQPGNRKAPLVTAYEAVMRENRYLASLLSPPSTWETGSGSTPFPRRTRCATRTRLELC